MGRNSRSKKPNTRLGRLLPAADDLLAKLTTATDNAQASPAPAAQSTKDAAALSSTPSTRRGKPSTSKARAAADAASAPRTAAALKDTGPLHPTFDNLQLTRDGFLQRYGDVPAEPEELASTAAAAAAQQAVESLPLPPSAFGLPAGSATSVRIRVTGPDPAWSAAWTANPPPACAATSAIGQKRGRQPAMTPGRAAAELGCTTAVSLVDLVAEYGMKERVAQAWAQRHVHRLRAMKRAGELHQGALVSSAPDKLELGPVSQSEQSRRWKRAVAAAQEAGATTADPLPLLSQTAAYLSPAQHVFLDALCSYRDVAWLARDVRNETQLRTVLALHVANHVVRARDLVQKHDVEIRSAITAKRKKSLAARMARAEAEEFADEDAAQGASDSDDGVDEGENPAARLDARNKLAEAAADVEVPEAHDQGLTRPRVIVLLPYKHAGFQFVRALLHLLRPGRTVHNEDRFFSEFAEEDAPAEHVAAASNKEGLQDWYDDCSDCEGTDVPDMDTWARAGARTWRPSLALDRKGRQPRPMDHVVANRGNLDDSWRLGISVARKSVRLYANFYTADIIVASPLGLRLIVGEEEDKKRDADFLSSVEIVAIGQADILLQQNWQHVLTILATCNGMPTESHGADFSRLRAMDVERCTKFRRQTVLCSTRDDPDIYAALRRYCANASGSLTIAPVPRGTIRQVNVKTRQVWHRLPAASLEAADESRLRYFENLVVPQLSAGRESDLDWQPNTLVYVPNYFTFVQLRNLCERLDMDVAPLSEYSDDRDITRARTMLHQRRLAIVLVTERLHFYRRLQWRAAKHIIFFGPPSEAQYYPEFVNMLSHAGSHAATSVLTLCTPLDALAVSRILGPTRAKQVLAGSSKGGSKNSSTFMFT